MSGNGEGILIILGLAAALTGLIAMASERRTWANLPNRKAALAVCLVGTASVLVGSVAAGIGATNTARAVASAKPATSAELEADAAAALAVREDALKKSEADSTAKLKAREDAVAAREAAIGPAEKAAASSAFKDGTWTVGLDIMPGTYRITKELMSNCYWSITKTGSNGGNIIENANVDGGFPMVTLTEGQTFESSRCGSWAKQ